MIKGSNVTGLDLGGYGDSTAIVTMRSDDGEKVEIIHSVCIKRESGFNAAEELILQNEQDYEPVLIWVDESLSRDFIYRIQMAGHPVRAARFRSMLFGKLQQEFVMGRLIVPQNDLASMINNIWWDNDKGRYQPERYKLEGNKTLLIAAALALEALKSGGMYVDFA